MGSKSNAETIQNRYIPDMWILQGDKAVLGQMVWVSEAYAKENCYPVTQKELENGIYN